MGVSVLSDSKIESDPVVDSRTTSTILGGLGRARLLRPAPCSPWSSPVTLTRFVTQEHISQQAPQHSDRAQHRASRLLLLTLMMTIWRNFYMSQRQRRIGAAAGHAAPGFADVYSMPSFYREKIRAIPGVAVVRSAESGSAERIRTTSRRISSRSSEPIPTSSSRSTETGRFPRIRSRPGSATGRRSRRQQAGGEVGWKVGDRRSSFRAPSFRSIWNSRFAEFSHAPRPTQVALLQPEICGRSGSLHEGAAGLLYHPGGFAGGRARRSRPADRRHVPQFAPAHRSRRAKPPSSLASWP